MSLLRFLRPTFRTALLLFITLSIIVPVYAADTLESWTMVVIPDTQRYTVESHDPGLQTFSTMTQWIVDNKDTLNIQMVMNEGDITGGNTAATWQVASDAMAILDNAGVPYSLTTGNHDHDTWDPVFQNSPSRDTLLNNYFTTARYEAMPTFGGTFEPGVTQNNYHLFTAGGTDYITMALEWGPRDETLTWADGVLTQYANRTAIITTHAYTYSDGTRYDWATKGTSQDYNPHCASYGFSTPHDGTENVNDGQEIWDKLITNHANVSMVLSGHLPWAGARQVSIGSQGQRVHELLAAYHDPPQGWLRVMEFNPTEETVQVKTYSPVLDQYMTDDANQFTLDLKLSTDPVFPEGSILVSTRLNTAGVVALDLSGNVVGGLTPDSTPFDIIDVQQIAPNGDILLGQHPAGDSGDFVSRYDRYGNFLGTVTGTVGDKYTAHLAVADPIDGSNLAFVEHNLGAISSIDLETNTVVNTLNVTGDPRGITVGPDGYVYMAVQDSGIWKMPQDLSSYEIVAADPTQDAYADITFGPDGLLYASTYVHDGVVRYDVTTGTKSVFVPDADDPNSLYAGVMFHPTTGNLLVSNYKTGDIREYDGTTGTYLGVFANIPNAWNMTMAPSEVKIPGDANGDGRVDGSDVTILAGNWQYGVGEVDPDGTWAMGDFNSDGRVDGSDVTILAGNWQYGVTAAASAVPEPGVMLLIFSAIVGMLIRRT